MFITLEGIDGSGKTTQANLIAKYFINLGKKVIITKEPGGGGDFSMEIRNLLSKSKTLLLSELFAIYAARNEHIQKVIQPALSEGYIIICDRFIDSTIAFYCYDKDYQNNSEDRNLIETLHKAVGNIMPDLTLFLDIDLQESITRIENRKIFSDKYDLMNLEQKTKIYNVYKYLISQYPNRIKTINAMQSEEEVLNSITTVLQNYL